MTANQETLQQIWKHKRKWEKFNGEKNRNSERPTAIQEAWQRIRKHDSKFREMIPFGKIKNQIRITVTANSEAEQQIGTHGNKFSLSGF